MIDLPPCANCRKDCIPDKKGRIITAYIHRLTTLDSYFCSKKCFIKYAKSQGIKNPEIGVEQ